MLARRTRAVSTIRDCTEGSCGDRISGQEVVPLPLSPGQLVMAGVRALDPAEATFLQAERVPVLTPSQLIRRSEVSRTMHGSGSDMAETAALIGECSRMPGAGYSRHLSAVAALAFPSARAHSHCEKGAVRFLLFLLPLSICFSSRCPELACGNEVLSQQVVRSP